jgi:hypothetical protein
LSSINTSPADKPDDSVMPRRSLTQQDSTLYFVRPAGLGVGVGVDVLVGVGVGVDVLVGVGVDVLVGVGVGVDVLVGVGVDVLVGVGVGVGVAAGQKVLSSHNSIEVLLIESTLFIDEHNTSFSLVIVPIL